MKRGASIPNFIANLAVRVLGVTPASGRATEVMPSVGYLV